MRKLTILLLMVPIATAQEQWPFGGRMAAMSGGDYYNLGLLGIKAEDASRPPAPENAPPKTGRRSVQMDRPSHDDGPARLRIRLLFPDGPAANAGLKKGDVIVFRDGALAPLAKMLLKAEAAKGVVTLRVIRTGQKKPEKVKVTIPTGGKAAAKPTVGAGRAALVKGALAWLANRQDESGGYKETLSGKNGAVVQVALAGLAWIGGGSDLENGPYQDNVKRAAEWLAGAVRALANAKDGTPGSNWNQHNWGLAYAAMFLGELHARTPNDAVKQALHVCAAKLVKTQETSGGWAHGPGGANGLGYVELNIVTGLVLCGLGVAQQSGFEVPKDCIDRAEAYLKKSSSGGGIGYSHVNNSGGNIGRTACAWIGYLALGRGKSGLGRQMGSFVKRNTDKALDGHASLMQHIQLGGIAAHARGKAREFWKAMQRDLVLARAPDGSFQPRPWHESLSMGSNSDVSVGEVWTTASWACVLVAPNFKALFGR